MTTQQSIRWEWEAREAERKIMTHYLEHPTMRPDGSFVMQFAQRFARAQHGARKRKAAK